MACSAGQTCGTCQSVCQYACQMSCQTCEVCQNTSEGSCGGTCQTTCQLGCQECQHCETTCMKSCQSCESGCQISCECTSQGCQTCQNACQLGCQTCDSCEGCETYCEDWCEICDTVCETICQDNCEVSGGQFILVRPSSWSWSVAKSSNAIMTTKLKNGLYYGYPITATDWNNFTDRINQFLTYKKLGKFGFTSVSSEDNFTTQIAYEAIFNINRLITSDYIDYQPSVSAYWFNHMASRLNSVT